MNERKAFSETKSSRLHSLIQIHCEWQKDILFLRFLFYVEEFRWRIELR